MNVIRKAALTNDLEELTILFNAYRVFYGKSPDLTGAHDFIKQRLIQNDSQIFIAEHEGMMSGFVQLYPIFSSTRMKKLWLLNDLFVDKKFRGRGISIALIDRAKQLCRDSGACGMYLETAKANTIGNQLYPKVGFTLNDDHNFYDWNV